MKRFFILALVVSCSFAATLAEFKTFLQGVTYLRYESFYGDKFVDIFKKDKTHFAAVESKVDSYGRRTTIEGFFMKGRSAGYKKEGYATRSLSFSYDPTDKELFEKFQNTNEYGGFAKLAAFVAFPDQIPDSACTIYGTDEKFVQCNLDGTNLIATFRDDGKMHLPIRTSSCDETASEMQYVPLDVYDGSALDGYFGVSYDNGVEDLLKKSSIMFTTVEEYDGEIHKSGYIKDGGKFGFFEENSTYTAGRIYDKYKEKYFENSPNTDYVCTEGHDMYENDLCGKDSGDMFLCWMAYPEHIKNYCGIYLVNGNVYCKDGTIFWYVQNGRLLFQIEAPNGEYGPYSYTIKESVEDKWTMEETYGCGTSGASTVVMSIALLLVALLFM